MLNEIVTRAKENCEHCMQEFGVHKYLPKEALGNPLGEQFVDRDKILIHLDFFSGMARCDSEHILEEIITDMDENHNPIFADGFDEEFYGEEEEEEEEDSQGDDDLQV